jgi:hypothetical protein
VSNDGLEGITKSGKGGVEIVNKGSRSLGWLQTDDHMGRMNYFIRQIYKIIVFKFLNF